MTDLTIIVYYCKQCGREYLIERPDDIPKSVTRVESNWCLDCKTLNSDEYKKTHITQERTQKYVNPNQLFP